MYNKAKGQINKTMKTTSIGQDDFL